MVSQEDDSQLVGSGLDASWGAGAAVLANDGRARRSSVEDGDRVPGTRGMRLQVEVAEGQLQQIDMIIGGQTSRGFSSHLQPVEPNDQGVT